MDSRRTLQVTLGAVCALVAAGCLALPAPSAPSAPATVGPVAPSSTVQVSTPAAPPTDEAQVGPVSAVAWEPVAIPVAAAGEAGRDRIDNVIKGGPGLVGWGRMGAPNRNQFNEVAAIYLSVDGSQWVTVPLVTGVGADDTAEIHRVVAGPAGLIAFGGTCCEDERLAAWRSPDGRAWERIAYPDVFLRAEIRDMVAVPNAYVAAGTSFGDATIWVSRDGIDWAAIEQEAADLGPGVVADIAQTGAGLIAVGHRADATWDGALWRSFDGLVWSRVAVVDPFIGALDVTLSQVAPIGDRLLVSGQEGDPAERRRCEAMGAARARIASADRPIPPPAPDLRLLCGWGHEVRWLGDDAGWRLVGGGGADPKPGELLEFHRVQPGDPGLLAIGEGLNDGQQSLWISVDGVAFARVAALGGPKPGDSVSGFIRLGNRIVAVGERWDPNGDRPGVPAVWIGRLR